MHSSPAGGLCLAASDRRRAGFCAASLLMSLRFAGAATPSPHACSEKRTSSVAWCKLRLPAGAGCAAGAPPASQSTARLLDRLAPLSLEAPPQAPRQISGRSTNKLCAHVWGFLRRPFAGSASATLTCRSAAISGRSRAAMRPERRRRCLGARCCARQRSSGSLG